MSFYCLSPQNINFPPVDLADEDGLLLIGGQLTKQNILKAYSKGIFPWYDEWSPVQWYAPHPRFVLFPDEIHISKSMKRILQSDNFSFSVDTAFADVISNCKTIERNDQFGTWITKEIEVVYTQLHKEGYAHSAETWQNGKLVGGIYGLRLGNVFCGESMFSAVSNASKFAFIKYVQLLKEEGIELIDCQVHTPHLQSLGARFISREDFVKFLPEENNY